MLQPSCNVCVFFWFISVAGGWSGSCANGQGTLSFFDGSAYRLQPTQTPRGPPAFNLKLTENSL